MAVTVSIANFRILADFLALEAESPEEAEMHSEDLDIFLDVLYEEADYKGQTNYDGLIQAVDPSKMPWAALHVVDGEYIPVFLLLLGRRDDLEGDDTGILSGLQKQVEWRAIYELAMKMQKGWRPPEWALAGEDPYVNPYAKDPTTDVGDDPIPVDEPVDNPEPDPVDSDSSQQTKPAVIYHDYSDSVKSERDMLLIGGGIGAAIMGGIWLTTSLLKAPR